MSAVLLQRGDGDNNRCLLGQRLDRRPGQIGELHEGECWRNVAKGGRAVASDEAESFKKVRAPERPVE